ncbi:MAG: rRNA (cytosine1962-C5)-methyltransferase [Kosmotogales bacterium]|nr:rRNA (cytosine1962-C5)-methyltransferase [Kosmotogales bacterium]
MVIVRIKNGKEKKVLNGYPWIYDDEIFSIENISKNIDKANVFTKDYKFLGTGFFNNFSNKKILILSNKETGLDSDFFMNKIKKAYSWRERFFSKPFYRLFYGEADGLGGFIVDRFENILVVQFRNGIIYSIKNQLIDCLIKLFNPKAILLRNDFETNFCEDVIKEKGLLYGDLTDNTIKIEENDIHYFIDIVNSQKTGFFFDQKDSRLYSRKVVKDFSFKSALDLFSFTGGFGLNMAKEGCRVISVDKSEEDLILAKKNARLNGVEDKITFVNSDAFNYLKEECGDKFDVSIIDPPSLIKKKGELSKGIKLFTELSEGGFRITKNGGILTICSCAYNFTLSHIIESMRKSSCGKNISFNFLNVTYQSKDHPWNLQIPETLYLKCLWSIIDKEDKYA